MRNAATVSLAIAIPTIGNLVESECFESRPPLIVSMAEGYVPPRLAVVEASEAPTAAITDW